MKKISLVLIVLVFIFIISCASEPEPAKDPYMDYPLTGLVYVAPEKDTTELSGTYFVGDSLLPFFGGYYLVSFKNDGTLLSTPSEYGLSSIDREMVEGTWNLVGSTMTIDVYDDTFSGTKVDAEGLGFAIKESSYNSLAFAKLSDTHLSSVSKSSIEGLWFQTDDYGKNYGYRFLQDGTCYRYGTDGTSYKTTWQLSTKATKLRIGDEFDNNIALINGYLLLGGVSFKKVK